MEMMLDFATIMWDSNLNLHHVTFYVTFYVTFPTSCHFITSQDTVGEPAIGAIVGTFGGTDRGLLGYPMGDDQRSVT